jgi:hypothetical protein
MEETNAAALRDLIQQTHVLPRRATIAYLNITTSVSAKAHSVHSNVR